MTDKFPLLKNDLILRVLAGHKVERTPVWIMRQAGRYLPEFRDVRKRNNFFDIVRTPELACEVTLQPIIRYGFDAAIIFSDILILCQSVGMKVEMIDGKGPVFKEPIRKPADLQSLNFDINIESSVFYLLEAIKLTRIRLEGRCPLIGFAGAPWTLMCYMIGNGEGGGAKNFSPSRGWLYSYPTESKYLLRKLAELVGNLLIAQAKAGAQILMVFESHGEVLNNYLFKTFSLPYLEIISTMIKESGITIPTILYAKGCHYAIDELLESDFTAIGIDWTIEHSKFKQSKKVLMGNLDPAVLYGSSKVIEMETERMLKSFEGYNHICNLGHGIHPDISTEAVSTFVTTVKNFKH